MLAIRVCAVLVMLGASAAYAQNPPAAGVQAYPNKPVRLLLGFSAGSSTDIVARLLAQRLGEQFNQTIVVENRTGAGGNIATDAVAKSAADGYTLLFTNNALANSVSLYSKLPYDAIRDFAPITQVSAMAHVMVIHNSMAARTVKDLVALAKQRPGELNFATIGTGSPDYMAAVLFKLLAKIDFVNIQYQSAPQAMADLIGGQVTIYFPGWPLAAPFVKSGRGRALAVSTTKRLPAIPQVPTMSESGVEDYEAVNWYALFAPANTAKEIVMKLNAEVAKILSTPAVRERFDVLGVEAVSTAPDELAAYLRSEIIKWARVAKAAGIKLD